MIIKTLKKYIKMIFPKKEEIVPLRSKTYVRSKFGGWDILIERIK